jgi:soluble lytic murein transglycosylase
VEVADEAWRKISGQFSAEEKSWAHLQLGVYAARQHQSDAMRFFGQVADVRVSDSQAAWWVRAALRAGDWKEVLRATDAMSETGRSENTWTYWRGRALAAAGKSELATAEYDRIKNGFGFYNWLAAEELKSAPQVLGNIVEPSAAQLAFFESNAGAQRAVALSKINLRFEAAREWNFILKDLPDAELAAASAWMQRKNVWDRSVSAAVRIKAQHDLSKRYVVPFSEALFGAAKDHGLEPALVAGLTRQESQFAPDVVSSAGAIGLMQLMPNTAKWVAKKMSRTYDRLALEDPATNAQFGAFYLRTVMDGLAGSPVLGLAAYNAGPGRAKNWQASKPLEGAIYAENILFNETRDYVKQVLVNAMWIDRVHAGGKGPSLKARLGLIPARGGSMTLAKDTP